MRRRWRKVEKAPVAKEPKPKSEKPEQSKLPCRWCGSTVNVSGDECNACRCTQAHTAFENPYNKALVQRDMSAAYRRALGYSTREPGCEQRSSTDEENWG